MFNLEELWERGEDSDFIPDSTGPQFEETFNVTGAGSAIAARAGELYPIIKDKVESSGVFSFDCDDYSSISVEHPGLAENVTNRANLLNLVRIVPYLSFFLKNINCPAAAQVKAIGFHLEGITFANISEAKLELRRLNEQVWTRRKSNSERQGSVSVLGDISENLLVEAFDTMIDNQELFKSNNSEIKSYGDFVLMALPNNLWFSVKSGFSRERLLASGYFNDVVGVGFFERADEFTSLPKVRNFKKVGFLAIYLPDVAVSDEQERDGTNTYDLVREHYDNAGIEQPKNINGTEFFRPLSSLGRDIEALKRVGIRNRTTINY